MVSKRTKGLMAVAIISGALFAGWTIIGQRKEVSVGEYARELEMSPNGEFLTYYAPPYENDYVVYELVEQNAFEVKDSFAGPGSEPRGLTWDGSHLWVADRKENEIYKIDPSTGNVVDSFDSPENWPKGLAWDGSYLWSTSDGSNKIYKLNPSTGNVVDNIDAPFIDPRALTWDGSYLWSVGGSILKIYKVDPSTGNVVDSFDSPAGYPVGLAWDGTYLWQTDEGGDNPDRIYKLDPSTGTVLQNKPLYEGETGITWVGTILWGGDWSDGNIYKSNMISWDAYPSEAYSLSCPPFPGHTTELDISNSGEEMIVVRGENNLEIRDPDTGNVLKEKNIKTLVGATYGDHYIAGWLDSPATGLDADYNLVILDEDLNLVTTYPDKSFGTEPTGSDDYRGCLQFSRNDTYLGLVHKGDKKGYLTLFRTPQSDSSGDWDVVINENFGKEFTERQLHFNYNESKMVVSYGGMTSKGGIMVFDTSTGNLIRHIPLVGVGGAQADFAGDNLFVGVMDVSVYGQSGDESDMTGTLYEFNTETWENTKIKEDTPCTGVSTSEPQSPVKLAFVSKEGGTNYMNVWTSDVVVTKEAIPKATEEEKEASPLKAVGERKKDEEVMVIMTITMGMTVLLLLIWFVERR